MLRRISELLNRNFKGVQEAALVVSGFTLVSQILGLVRDRLLAGTFGADTALDIYYTAFRIPDLIFVAIASFFSFTILIPFFLQKERESHDSARSFLSMMFTSFMILMIVVSIIAYILMPYLAPVIAPGFGSAELNTMTQISRWLLLSPVILGMSNLLSTVTQATRRFFVYALSPVLYNVGIIIGILALYPAFGLLGIAYGVVIGAVLHLIIQIPVLVHVRYIPRIIMRIDWRMVWSVMKTSLPRTLTLAFSTISLTVLGALATTIGSGSVAVFDLSKNLHSVPIALIGISFSVAAFPSMVRLFEKGDISAFASNVRESARHIIFWSIPVIGLFIVLRAQIVRVIFGTGRFDWTDTRLTAAVLALFVLSVAAHNVMLLVLRGYYAAQYTKKPLVIVGVGSVITMVLGYLFLLGARSWSSIIDFISSILRIPAIPEAMVVVLPFAYTIGICVICVLLWRAFSRDFVTTDPHDSLWKTMLHSVLATIMLSVVSYGGLQIFAEIFDINTFWGIFGQGLIAGVIGIIAAGCVFVYLKTPEFMLLVGKSKQRFRHIVSMPQYPDKEA